MSVQAIAADFLFDGCKTHEEAAVVIEGSLIAAIQPQATLARDHLVHRLPPGTWLSPGFIDVQVNGGGDVLFNDSPTPETILKIAAAHRRFGTTSLLPTFITDTRDKTRAAIAAAQQARRKEPSVLGIHLEGPYLSPERPGVHDRNLIRPPDDEDLEMLCSDWQGTRLITLAPECVPKGFIAKLVSSGWHVSLGHSAATYDQTCAAMAEGLSGFTHLFNAMRPMSSREPGPIAAALETPEVWYGVIVDGHHVSLPMLRLALRGVSQPMLVTDAMPPVGGLRGHFQLYGREIHVAAGACHTTDGTLAGTVLDMATAVRNCVKLLRVSLPDTLRFASAHPAEFLGLGDMLGKLAPGYRADLVAIDAATLTVLGTWMSGEYQAAH